MILKHQEARRRSRKNCARLILNQSTLRLMTFGASICVVASLLVARQTDAGRIQDFIQSIVGRNNNNNNGNSNSNNNNNESSSSSNSGQSNSDSSDAAESSTNSDSTSSQQQQQNAAMDPMMSAAMSQFMRYPSFYGSFAPQAGFGGFPGMSFSNPMAAMSSFSPLAMSANSLSGFAPTGFGSPASFGSTYGSMSSNPLSSAYGASGVSGLSGYGGGGSSSASGASNSGMSASSLSNAFAAAPGFMGPSYAPYYGRRK